jgi:hypothetical protein
MTKAEMRREIEVLKRKRFHAVTCAVKPYGGIGAAGWSELDRRNCTCFLGQRIRELRAAIHPPRAQRPQKEPKR